MVVFDRNNYIFEVERQLNKENIYKPVTFNEKLIEDLTECTNKVLKDLRRRSHLFEKQLMETTVIVARKKRHVTLGALYF